MQHLEKFISQIIQLKCKIVIPFSSFIKNISQVLYFVDLESNYNFSCEDFRFEQNGEVSLGAYIYF